MSANLALIGFSEARSTFARNANWVASAYDISTERKQGISDGGLRACNSPAEALTDELTAASDAADATREVLSSLDGSDKSESWTVHEAYNLERMTTHGALRAAAMDKVANTLTALNFDQLKTCGHHRSVAA